MNVSSAAVSFRSALSAQLDDLWERRGGLSPDDMSARQMVAAAEFAGGEFGMPCVLVLKRLPAGAAHAKAALNGILRDHGVNA